MNYTDEQIELIIKEYVFWCAATIDDLDEVKDFVKDHYIFFDLVPDILDRNIEELHCRSGHYNHSLHQEFGIKYGFVTTNKTNLEKNIFDDHKTCLEILTRVGFDVSVLLTEAIYGIIINDEFHFEVND